MKRWIPLFSLVVTYLALFISTSLASVLATPSCQNVNGHGNNIQCIYKVMGQKIGHPHSDSNLYATTDMPYALCSKAQCVITKRAPRMADCLCKIYGLQQSHLNHAWMSASVGPKSFKNSAPERTKTSLVSVTSNFSLANTKNLDNPSKTTCAFDEPTAWANCFGIRCGVVYIKSNHHLTPRAICHCPIVKTKVFLSMGPKDSGQCILGSNKIWSAATAQQGKNNTTVMQRLYKTYFGVQIK